MTTDPAEKFASARAAAGVLFFDEHDRVFMVVPSYKDYRDIPGYVDTASRPTAANQSLPGERSRNTSSEVLLWDTASPAIK